VKNFGKAKARDVTVIVRFQDKRKKPLGVQRVSVVVSEQFRASRPAL
jgi:hypothetical protein